MCDEIRKKASFKKNSLVLTLEMLTDLLVLLLKDIVGSRRWCFGYDNFLCNCKRKRKSTINKLFDEYFPNKAFITHQ